MGPARPQSTQRRHRGGAPASRRRTQVLAAAAAVVAVAASALWHEWHEQSPPPPELLGRWATDEPGYEGRYFEIDPSQLVIETGVLGKHVHPILDVDERRRGNLPLYVIHFLDYDGTDSSFRLIARQPDLSEVQFEDRRGTWRRVAGPGR
jgi:hypothetical protein